MRRAPAFALTIALLAAPAQAATYPLTLNNCGIDITIAKARPSALVAIKSTATEMLLSLGLADRIVGVGFQDGPLPPDLASAGSNLKVLADKVPSQEVVLAAEPDFIYGGWESNFAGDAAGERPTLAQLGIASYVAPAACRSVQAAEPDLRRRVRRNRRDRRASSTSRPRQPRSSPTRRPPSPR